MQWNRVWIIAVIIILIAALFQPAVASSCFDQNTDQKTSYLSVETVSALEMLSQLQVQNLPGMELNVTKLIEVSPNKTDTDGDGLPDSVEAILGTDFNNTDTDFDQLDDYNETILYGSDPLEPDSNHDGLADYHEVTNVPLDLDEDGFPNVWDLDNDNDGVIDALDLSPFSKSTTNDSFHFDIKTNGSPTYIDFQLRPNDPDHLRLPVQSWDWPPDHDGTMMDLNLSSDDVRVIPMLELTMNTAPDQSDVKDYNINVVGADNDRVAFKTYNGMYISAEENALASDSTEIGENETFELIEADNNTVALKAGNGQYISVNSTGALLANGSEIGENETFELIDLDNNTVALKASNGLYVKTTDTGGLVASNDTIGTSEIFELIYIKEVVLKASNGLYVSAIGGGAGGLYANAGKIGSWETFELIDFGDTVAIRAINELYVYGDEGGLVANRYTIGTGEIFELVDLGNSKVALNASNGLYVGVEGNKLVANSTAIGENETFELELLKQTRSKAYIPLIPVNDNGNSLALKGRMFYPASAQLNLSVDAELTWIVQGKTDQTGRKVAFKNSAGQYISHKEGKGWPLDGEILVNEGGPIDQKKTFELVELGGNKVALKASNGKYITFEQRSLFFGFSFEQIYPLLAKSDKIGTKETFEIESIGNIVRLKASNNMYVSLEDFFLSGPVFVLGSQGDAEIFEIIDVEPTESETTILASYKEDFMLTGFSVEENYGSDAGVFYSDDKNQTLQAGLVMTYEFMRNQTSLPEMPALINNTNVTVSSNISYFPHQDGALLGVTIHMTPGALNLSSADQVLPVLTAIEDHFANKGMDEFVSGSYVLGNSYEIDITNEPVATTKIMKMGWYNTSTKEVLELDDLLMEIEEWGQALDMDDDELAFMMGLIFTWNVGEVTVPKIGYEEIDFNLKDETQVILKDIKTYGINGIKGICSAIKIKTYIISKLDFKKLLLQKPVLSKAPKTFLKSEFTKIKMRNGATTASKFGSRVGSAIAIIGLIIDICLAVYGFFSIAIALDWSTAGVWTAVFAATLMIVYAVLLFALACAFPVGTIIAAIIGIIDMILSIFGLSWLDWLIGIFYKVEVRTKLDLQIKETNPFLDDYDKNGLDVGDRIELRSRMDEKVWRTSDGNWGDVCDSYLTPSYVLPPQYWLPFFNNPHDGGTYRNTVSESLSYPNSKLRTHDVGLWVQPGRSKINFPLTFWLLTQYKYYINECYFFGAFCDRESESGSSLSDPTTIYYDVLPGNISDFANWHSISSLDKDGDGLLNSEEGTYGTSQYLYDTDGDGLPDKFEVDYGTSPTLSDTDGDGLDDGSELRIGTNASKEDTDGDGLSDFEEDRGWLVSFTYGGEVFIMHTTSDPLIIDTDGDGLDDFEEFFKKLNPRSKDTDGDGTLDIEVFGSQDMGLIKYLDMNHEGNSIKADPGENISATVGYRIKGQEINGTDEPDDCQIIVTVNNSSFIIYNGTPEIGNKTEDVYEFSFNASDSQGIFLVKYYLNWSSIAELPPEGDREIIGVIDTTNVTCGDIGWVNETVDSNDTDGDGLIDYNEKIGWGITFTGISDVGTGGTFTIHVTSEDYIADTDYDGLTDLEEYNNCSNPRDVDTDGDMLIDFVEIGLGTNLLMNDTDTDGLDDGTEIVFGSSPLVEDTDADGLTDFVEFGLASDPSNPDTDGDGLNDSDEYDFGSNLLKPDSDEDMLLDYDEHQWGTDPWNPDSDEDELTDGYEVSIGTNPLNNDTDGDGLLDKEELDIGTNASNNDTDGDGLLDKNEIDLGTDPTNEDTDDDGTNDYDDLDSYALHVESVVLVYDSDPATFDFISKLAQYTNVTTVSPDEFMNNHTNASHIVLVGRPSAGDGTAGNITYTILKESSDILAMMWDSDANRLFTDYGIWNSTQTVVMLSHPYPLDHFKVLSILKSFIKIVHDGSVIVQFQTARTIFSVEAIKETDSFIRVDMANAVIPTIEMTIYNTTTVPYPLSYGLSADEKVVGKYLEINVSENVQNETAEIIDHAIIVMYYTASDLDRTGDMDANDVGDIDENTLGLIWYNTSVNKWEKLSSDMDWVYETGVQTTDGIIYGTYYEGYVWANVSHLSVYGMSGQEITQPPEEEDGINIVPMFSAVPQVTFYKFIQLSAGEVQNVSITNIPGIYELSLKYPEIISLMLYLSEIKYLPSDVPEAPGEVYSYFEMLFTKTKTNIKVDPVTQIYFKVPKDFATDKERITLMHYENGWNRVETEVTGEDGENYYCMAEVTSFSIFAITLTTPEPGGLSILEEPTISREGTQEPTPEAIPGKLPVPFELIILIFALLIALGFAYYLSRRKRL